MSEAQNGGNVMERLTNNAWRNFDPWECCGQDKYCQRGCHDPGGCTKGCIVPQLYARLGAYEDTGLTPGEVKSMQEEHFSGLEMAKLHSALMELKKYQEADKDGRLVVLPFTSGRTLLCKENIDSLRLMKDVQLAICYCSSCGIVFHMDYNVFCDLVKQGKITAVSEEAEKVLGAKKDE